MTAKHWTLVTAGVAGGLALGLTGYASAAGSPSPAPAPRAHDGQGPGGHGADRGPGMHRRGPGGLVTAISAGSLTVRTPGGTKTIALNSSTAYYEGQTKAAESDVKVGEIVRIRLADPKATSPVAISVTVVPAHLAGFVTAITDTTITIVDESGFTRTVQTSVATTYTKDGAAGKRSDITVGALVRAAGSVDANGTTLDAAKVAVGKPAAPKGSGAPGAEPGAQQLPADPPPGDGLDG